MTALRGRTVEGACDAESDHRSKVTLAVNI